MLKNFIHIALIVLLAAGGTACKEKKKAAPPPGELTEAQKAELRAKALSNLMPSGPSAPFTCLRRFSSVKSRSTVSALANPSERSTPREASADGA